MLSTHESILKFPVHSLNTKTRNNAIKTFRDDTEERITKKTERKSNREARNLVLNTITA